MHVGDDHAHDGQALELLGEDLFPLGAAAVAGHTAVDHGPAVASAGAVIEAVAQQPEVDVVQRKGQAHAYPFDAWRHFQAAAGRGQFVCQRVVDFMFKQIHGGRR
ncbi:hypothetical protein D3C71_1666700 [compost metagenome]